MGENQVLRFRCYGIDYNPANIDAAEERNIPDIYLGDCENIDEIFPPDMHFDLIIFSGLLNRQVVDRDKARRILDKALLKLSAGGHIIITGYTSCHLTADNLAARGIDVLRKSIPPNLFKDYMNYYLRQLYLGRKNN
jgi:SAM-dependent methyltransferase